MIVPYGSVGAMDDPFKLQRFIDAQEPVYATVIAELRAGAKQSHWMWFIFPQVAGLGFSATSRHFAIGSAGEARAYDAHGLLGQRLRECFRLVLASGAPVAQLFPHPDDMKYHSSATLFAAAVPEEPLYAAALDRGFGGRRDALTVQALARS